MFTIEIIRRCIPNREIPDGIVSRKSYRLPTGNTEQIIRYMNSVERQLKEFEDFKTLNYTHCECCGNKIVIPVGLSDMRVTECAGCR